MPREMTPEDVAMALKTAGQLDVYDYRNDEDDDDYISAVLYGLPDGRLFRLVTASGMNSVHSGAGNIGEWLTDAERARWTTF